FPAVSSNIKTLLGMGYIEETGAGGNSLGRKSTLLSFNARRGFVIGIDIGRWEIRYILTDLLGNKLKDTLRENIPAEKGSRILKRIVGVATRLVADAGVGDDRILAVCVGIPGILRDNRMYAAPFISDFSLMEMSEAFEQRFGAAVLVENSVNLGALGERWRGTGERYTDFVYVGYGVGLGAALILGGKLYKGVNGAAGEIGFMAVDPAHLQARFCDAGSLEGLISHDRLTRTFPDWQYCADAEQVKRALAEACRYFGMSLVNVAALVNPQAIVVSGGLGRALGKHFGAAWSSMLKNHLPFPPAIAFSGLGGQEPLQGAVYTALEHVYNAPIA
ncbi:MAG: ROK family protein, partial [Planctomycetaceae bacterium]|nr:ROK family protein [Planctomycetaceae bacterium]